MTPIVVAPKTRSPRDPSLDTVALRIPVPSARRASLAVIDHDRQMLLPPTRAKRPSTPMPPQDDHFEPLATLYYLPQRKSPSPLLVEASHSEVSVCLSQDKAAPSKWVVRVCRAVLPNRVANKLFGPQGPADASQ